MDSWTTRKYITKICPLCNTSFTKKMGFTKYCSPECSRKGHLERESFRRRSSVEYTLRVIAAGCKNRAKRTGKECDIDVQYLLDKLKEQDGKCAMTGVELLSSRTNTRINSHPHTVTVDRIDSTKGYTKDNVQIVSYIYNCAKNNWSHDDVIQMAKGVLKYAY